MHQAIITQTRLFLWQNTLQLALEKKDSNEREDSHRWSAS